MDADETIERVTEALERAREILGRFAPGRSASRPKASGEPVTEVDLALDAALRALLPRPDEGWLSEETPDGPERLGKRRVWIVDPLDGTHEFIAGIPEWGVSICLAEEGRAVAGGVLNGATGELFVGARGRGVLCNGSPVHVSAASSLKGARILASRTEVGRGQWKRFEGAPFSVRPTGSAAYKLALVAAGRADATWTLVPKNEWDVAAGAALVEAAGGLCLTLDGEEPRFNTESHRHDGFVACAPGIADEIRELLGLPP